jgi:hypothetical protein
MPRTPDQLEEAARAAEAWLNAVDPADLDGEDPVDLRRLGRAVMNRAETEGEVTGAVAACRAAGRTWSEIGMILGVSKQSARERYGHRITSS